LNQKTLLKLGVQVEHHKLGMVEQAVVKLAREIKRAEAETKDNRKAG
jgi:hypothetical protein